MKTIKGYEHRVKDAYRDEDGCWIVLSKNWKCPSGYYGTKTIHESTWKEAIAILKKTIFTLSD